MARKHQTLTSLLDAIAAAIRGKTGETAPIVADDFPEVISSISTGVELPSLTNPAGAAQILSGYEAIDGTGAKLTGTIPSKGAGDLTASGASVTVPAGYYPSQVSKSVAAAAQATPSISINSSGLITASATQGAGYVPAGTKSATKQLSTKGAETITPGTSNKTIGAPVYLTGTQTIKGDANLVPENIKSGVSIFGVAGALDPPVETTTLTLKNDSVTSIKYYCTPISAGSMSKSSAKTLSCKIGELVSVAIDETKQDLTFIGLEKFARLSYTLADFGIWVYTVTEKNPSITIVDWP